MTLFPSEESVVTSDDNDANWNEWNAYDDAIVETQGTQHVPQPEGDTPSQPVTAGTSLRGRARLVVILCGALFYVTVTFSFLLVYGTSKKKVVFFPLKLKA